MMNEYYELLGLTENATDEEVKARYEELREKYREERWLDGEAGNEAAKMLTKIETAYAEICASRQEYKSAENDVNAYEEIAALLKEGKVEDAQRRLDDCNERGAEWHYLQAVVFYKKNWTNDSKKQLEIALQMDPTNEKYKSSYEKMKAKNEYERQSAREETANPYARERDQQFDEDSQMGGNACSDCISCCYSYLCVSCCFDCCCGCR
jgi:hypothetical protein